MFFIMVSIFFQATENEPPHDKTIKMACAPSEDSDQTGHPDQPGLPPSLIRVFAGHTCHFVGFVMRQLKSLY